MSKPKLNLKEESSAKKTRSPPKKTKVEQSVPKKKKLKTDAEKAAEKAQHLRFGKAELTPDELSRLSKARDLSGHAGRSALSVQRRPAARWLRWFRHTGHRLSDSCGSPDRQRICRHLQGSPKVCGHTLCVGRFHPGNRL